MGRNWGGILLCWWRLRKCEIVGICCVDGVKNAPQPWFCGCVHKETYADAHTELRLEYAVIH